MAALDTILVPTDFSKSSDDALEIAGRLAHRFGATLVLLHVVPPALERITDHAKAKIDSVSAPLRRDGIDVFTRIAVGDPAEEIGRAARELDTDLIVIGAHGRRGARRMLLGHVAAEVIPRASCPVLATPRGSGRTAIATILAPLDSAAETETSQATLQYATALALTFGAKLVLMHGAEPGETESMRGELAGLQANLHALGVETEVRVDVGDATDVIVRAVRIERADLVVMATRAQDGLLRLLQGSVTDRVLRSAGCPLLTLTPEIERANDARQRTVRHQHT